MDVTKLKEYGLKQRCEKIFYLSIYPIQCFHTLLNNVFEGHYNHVNNKNFKHILTFTVNLLKKTLYTI